MEEKKDSIDKIDSQIQDLINAEKEILNPTSKEEVLSDPIEVEEEMGDTKKIDTIEDLKEAEEVKKEVAPIEVLEETPTVEKKEEVVPPKKKKFKLVWILLLIFVFVLIIVFIISNSSKKTKKSDISKEEILSKNEQEEIMEDYGKALEGILAIYYDKQKILLEYEDAIKLINFDYKVLCKEHEIYEDGKVYLNQCTIDSNKDVLSYGEKQEKIEEPVVVDDSIHVYVHKTYRTTTFNKPKDFENYEDYEFKIDDAYGELTLLNEYDGGYVFYYDEDYNVQMINYKTGKKVLNPLNYSSVLPIKVGDSYDSNFIAVCMNDKWGIYNINTRERVVSHIYDNVSMMLTMGTSGPPFYISSLENGKIAVYQDGKYGVIDYTNGNVIVPLEYHSMLKTGSFLWVKDDQDIGHILDYSGNEYLKDTYLEVYGFVDGKYALVRTEKSVQMVQLDGKVLYDYGDLTLGKLNYFFGYNGALFSFEKVDSTGENDCFEITYDSTTKTGEAKDFICGGIAKPILYLYPKNTTKVTVSFEHPEYLETTYPKFVGKWTVTAKSNGDLYDSNNRYYYGLYWDEKQVHRVDFSKGYYVEGKDAITFLEKKLDYIGLSEREANEFITYWLPVLEKNKKSLVYFELTKERESVNKISIDPKPDSLLRLVIHIKKVDHKVEIPKQSLERFQRKGFVAVEWGGTTY